MFSLIITLIAIALVAALALASTYYGGSAFTQGGAKADASALVNGAQQIAAGYVLYQSDNAGSVPADVAALVTGNYLASEPAAPTGTFAISGSNVVVTDAVTSAVCGQVRKQAGTGTDITVAPDANEKFDCGSATNATADDGDFVYKVM